MNIRLNITTIFFLSVFLISISNLNLIAQTSDESIFTNDPDIFTNLVEENEYDMKDIRKKITSSSYNNLTLNVTESQVVNSDVFIHVNTSVDVAKTEYIMSLTGSMEYNLSSDFNIKIPAYNLSKVNFYISFYLYNSSNINIQNYTINLILDNGWVNIINIPTSGKYLPNKILPITYDNNPIGINWRWDRNNVITDQYSSNPIITTPIMDGSYRLVLIITNLRAEEQPALNYYYMIDGTAPQLSPSIDISGWLPAGMIIPFVNNTDFDKKTFNFTFIGSGVYTSEFPRVPSPSGNYILFSSVFDELGNIRVANFTIHAKIGLLNISPDVAGRPGQQMKIELSETPDIENYGFYFSNNSIYYENDTAPKIPTRLGNYIFKLTVRDIIGNWLNKTYSILVDNTSLQILSVYPLNNSIIYDTSTPISILFDETPFNLFYTFGGFNETGNIYCPEPAAYYNLTIYASDVAENWIVIHLSYYRYYRPILFPSNGSSIFTNDTIHAGLDIPFDVIIIHWDQKTTNSSITQTPVTSGLHLLNITIINGNIISQNLYTYFIKVFVKDIFIPERIQGNTKINVNFSESNTSFSYKWDNSVLWKFSSILTPNTEGNHVLKIKMFTKDFSKEYIESFIVLVDNTPPSVTLITPLTTINNPRTTHSGTNITIFFSDNNCNNYCISSIEYSWENYSNHTITFTTKTNNVSLGVIPQNVSSTQLMNLSITITDIANNSAVFLYQYKIDDFSPYLLNELPSDIDLPCYFSFNISEMSDVNVTILIPSENYTDHIIVYSTSYFSYRPNIYGNHSIEMYISLYDELDNNRSYIFYINTKDSALRYDFNTNKLISGQNLNFTVNRPLKNQFLTIILENGTQFNFDYLNSTFPRLNSYEGMVTLNYSMQDFQPYWTNGSIKMLYDSIVPKSIIFAKRLINNSVIREDSFFQRKIDNILDNQSIKIKISDKYEISGTVYYEYIQNYQRISQTIVLNNTKELSLYLPFNTTSGQIIFNVFDEYGNNLYFEVYLDIVSIPVPHSTSNHNSSDNSLIIMGLSVGSIGTLGIATFFLRNKIKTIFKGKK